MPSPGGGLTAHLIARSSRAAPDTVRAKRGQSVRFCEAAGFPVGWAHDGANRHDSKRLEPTIDSIPIERPAPSEKYPAWIAAMTTTASITFLQPELVWDFRVERAASINISGHKYGLTPWASAGWCGGPRTCCRRS
jgi:hypothetical protein